MPKRPEQILFPTCILGQERRSVKYRIKDAPKQDGHYVLTLTWSGKRIVAKTTWTKLRARPTDPIIAFPFTQVFTDGDITTATIQIPPDEIYHPYAFTYMYFDCTDCGLLVVNGEILIGKGEELIKYYADKFQPILGVHNPTEPDDSVPSVPDILTYYANKFKAIFGLG